MAKRVLLAMLGALVFVAIGTIILTMKLRIDVSDCPIPTLSQFSLLRDSLHGFVPPIRVVTMAFNGNPDSAAKLLEQVSSQLDKQGWLPQRTSWPVKEDGSPLRGKNEYALGSWERIQGRCTLIAFISPGENSPSTLMLTLNLLPVENPAVFEFPMTVVLEHGVWHEP